MIDLDGNVIWSGSKTVRTTDIIPSSWEAQLDGRYRQSHIRTGWGRKDENFDYFQYYEDTELQRTQLRLIIDSLIDQLPLPHRL